MVRDVKEQSGRRKGWVRYNFMMMLVAIMLVVILLVVVMLVVIFFMLVNFDGD